MITQKFQQGDHEIRIESAESIADAEQNNFTKDTYNRFFIDNKPCENYMAMMRFIVDEVKTNRNTLVKNDKELIESRDNMIKNQIAMIRVEVEKIKQAYGNTAIPEHIFTGIDDMVNKLDNYGIRVGK
jgi:hypothetical protein